jgi:hypothetical protein
VYESWQEKYNDNRLHNFQNRKMHVKNGKRTESHRTKSHKTPRTKSQDKKSQSIFFTLADKKSQLIFLLNMYVLVGRTKSCNIYIYIYTYMYTPRFMYGM